jgi:Protein of unknown function (DUF3072)
VEVNTMATKNQQPLDDGRVKEPEDWVTGDEPMTGAQDSYLHTLAREAGEEVEEDLTKAETSEKIDELQEKTGRGTTPSGTSKRGRSRVRRRT